MPKKPFTNSLIQQNQNSSLWLILDIADITAIGNLFFPATSKTLPFCDHSPTRCRSGFGNYRSGDARSAKFWLGRWTSREADGTTRRLCHSAPMHRCHRCLFQLLQHLMPQMLWILGAKEGSKKKNGSFKQLNQKQQKKHVNRFSGIEH